MAAPSFETGAARPPQDEAAQGIPNPRLVAEPFAIIPSHDVKQPISFPRRMSAPGVCDFASLTPNRGVGGAPRNVRVQRHPLGVPSVRHKTRVNALMTRHARRLARRLASHDAGRSPLGAPPWRFWASGPRFSHRHPPLLTLRRAPDRAQRAPRSQVVVPGGRGPGPPGASGYEPPPQDATPRSAFRIVSRRRPSMSEDGKLCSMASSCSQ